MKLTKEELMQSIKSRLGETPSDEDIKFIEDVTDTLAEFGQPNQAEEWKKKYEENDKQWREKYTSRFFETTTKDDDVIPPVTEPKTEETRAETIGFNDLFKE